jgi:Flp pilus assembly protein TadB
VSEAIILAAGLVGGADWRVVAVAAGAVWAPLPTLAAVAGVTMVGWRLHLLIGRGAEARFAEIVVGELRAGGSLRFALRTACAGRDDCAPVVRRLDIGVRLAEAVDGLARILPGIGALIETAMAVGAGAGAGRMLPLFEELVALATADEQGRAEVLTATAQVRASMWVLIGGPLAYMVWSVVNGRLGQLVTLPGGLLLATIGSGLFAIGTTLMTWMGRR